MRTVTDLSQHMESALIRTREKDEASEKWTQVVIYDEENGH